VLVHRLVRRVVHRVGLRLCAGIALASCASAGALAASSPADAAARDLESSLRWRTGEIPLGDGIAHLALSADWRFLGPDDTERVLVEAWHNPPDRKKPLGMLFAADVGPLAEDAWAVVLSYTAEGHVSDDDAEKIDYDALLREMQAAARARNDQRVKDGYLPVELVGWAARPYYDRAQHKLHWARELRFGDERESTLNYDVRVLGRRGVLVMQAVAPMARVEPVSARMRDALAMVEFAPGQRYEDFDSRADEVAAYGIGGLVAGGLLAKAGFFKLLFAGLVAAKKFVVLGLVAVGGAFARYFRRSPASAHAPDRHAK
jgi:uncharacterized membrane-anchored protein